MTKQITSRERMLRALNHEPVDVIPCSFMSFAILRKRCEDDPFRAAETELAMGLDAMLFIPSAPRSQRPEHPDLRGLPVRRHTAVITRERRETAAGGPGLLYKMYETPAGNLTTSVRLSDDWPHGDHIPFVDDYQIPRAQKFLVSGQQDLEPLAYMLLPPSDEDAAAFAQSAAVARAFCEERGILLAGGWGVGIDMANWLCGMENLTYLMFDQPEFVDALLEMIFQWNLRRMQVVLQAGVDVFFRRAWYEGADFLSPSLYRKYILPRLKREADLAHEYGAKFAYICSSGSMPLLGSYLEAGIDALVGVDPVQGVQTDMRKIKEKIGSRVCLWGGVSGAVTVEMGGEDEVRRAVDEAVDALGPDGFILSPVDNLTVDEPRTWVNVDIFIDQWKRRWLAG